VKDSLTGSPPIFSISPYSKAFLAVENTELEKGRPIRESWVPAGSGVEDLIGLTDKAIRKTGIYGRSSQKLNCVLLILYRTLLRVLHIFKKIMHLDRHIAMKWREAARSPSR